MLNFDEWYDKNSEELYIAAAESGADREFGYDSEKMLEDAYQVYCEKYTWED